MTATDKQPAILLVDDEAPVLAALQRTLQGEGYEIHTSVSGAEALDLLRQKSISVMVCDLRMPGMSGSEVLAEAYRISPDTGRIVLTGHADMAAAIASVNEGHVTQFLLKPWDDDLLRTVIHEAAECFQIVRERRARKDELEQDAQRLEKQVGERTAELESQMAELRILQQRLKQSLDDAVALLAGVLEANNPNAALHSKRVARLARQLGEQVNMEPQDLADLEYAAALHDIGKIARSQQLPRARGRPLAAHQLGLEQRSAESGYVLLSRVRGFDNVAHAVRHQHENHDGSGPPEGRRGEAIPLAARIIAIANAYDDAAHVAHSARVDAQRGCRVLLGGRNTRFDPALVALFVQGVRSLAAEQREDDELEVSPGDLSEDMVLSRDMRNADGVLVLKRGTTLTHEHIARIRAMGDVDPLLSSVYVRCTPTEQDSATAVATVPEPAADGAKAADAAASTTRGEQPSRRALIVDDDVLVCNALSRELRRAGWTITCAENGREAQQILEENQFDLLLVDVAMPLMTGDMLVAHVQQCWPEVPCIVLTGHATREQLLRLSTAENVTEILAKPWDHDRLLAAIDTAMRKSQPAVAAGAG